MKKTIVSLIVAMFVMVPIFSNGTSETKTSVTHATFGGSSTVAPIAEAAIEPFEQANSDLDISYETLGSSVGIKQLLEGTLSMAGSSRELKDSEVQAGAKPYTIALDALSVAVNESVGIANLSMEQLAAIFAGEITNWKEVGGADAPIVTIVRDESSGTYGSFEELVLESHKKTQTKNAIVARENGELAAKIASTENSIGYIGMAFTHLVEESGGTILTIDGVAPTERNVQNKSYPINRGLYLVSKGDLASGSPEKRFLDFMLSEEGQEIVSQTGYVKL